MPIASTKRRPRGSSSISRSTFIYARPSLTEDLFGLQDAVARARDRNESAGLVQDADEALIRCAAQLLTASEVGHLSGVERQLRKFEARVHRQQQVVRAAVRQRIADLVDAMCLLDAKRAARGPSQRAEICATAESLAQVARN